MATFERCIGRGNIVSFCNEMMAYTEYVERLHSLLSGYAVAGCREWRRLALSSLNGEPAQELRRIVDIKALRDSGAFFTSAHLASRAFSSLHKKLSEYSVIVDPSCGAGDLLLTVARCLPLARSVVDTCRAWGKRLAGFDKHEEFVNATKLRLAILAAYRHNVSGVGECNSLVDQFHLIGRADGLSESHLYHKANAVIVNPPFSVIDAPSECEWGAGGINMAALFIDKILREVRPGTRVVGILPDVLRTGSRYSSWRQRVEESAEILSLRQHGLFDRWADVDVFILDLALSPKCKSLRKQRVSWVPTSSRHQKSVGDYFEVHVGPVVPHRHKETGPALPFIHARCLPKWQHCETIHESRHFAGTTFESPFVAVRRTSRPSEANRAIGTIVTAPGSIAVENHLIVLRPKDGRLETCRQLIRVLRSEKTNQWLNRRIRCRHLTVSSIREVPWESTSL
jgi:hypothetical protein